MKHWIVGKSSARFCWREASGAVAGCCWPQRGHGWARGLPRSLISNWHREMFQHSKCSSDSNLNACEGLIHTWWLISYEILINRLETPLYFQFFCIFWINVTIGRTSEWANFTFPMNPQTWWVQKMGSNPPGSFLRHIPQYSYLWVTLWYGPKKHLCLKSSFSFWFD